MRLYKCRLSTNSRLPTKAEGSYSENIFFALLRPLNRNYNTGEYGLCASLRDFPTSFLL